MAQKISPQPNLPPGVYQHCSGKLYAVIDTACHSETLEWYVIYKPLYEHKGMPDTWIRPLTMFVEQLTINGVKIPRFKKIDPVA